MKALIFDLDGTLVDSAEGILESLRHAFAVCGLQTARALAADCIGPPVREIFSSLMDPKDIDRLDDLLMSFKANYDSEGFRKSRPYPGTGDMLSTLSRSGLRLNIVTNKRSRPTGRLIASLGWDRLFDRIYSIDSFPAETHTKAGLLRRLLCDARLETLDCCYVGDRLEDARAATEVGLAYFHASWGYGGDLASQAIPGTVLATPDASLFLRTGSAA